MTDPVAAMLGEDLLVRSASFFIRQPAKTSYVPSHRDLHYWGLCRDDEDRPGWR